MTVVTSLVTIRDRYASWTDPLSVRLRQWIDETDTSNLEQRVGILVSKILVNPLNERIPLRSPDLDRIWVWDGEFLKHYQQQTGSNVSPFDGKPIEAKPHAFAREVLAWLRPAGSEEERGVVANTACGGELVAPGEEARTIFLQYYIFAQRFIQRELCRHLTSSLDQSAKALERTAAVSQAETERLKEKNARVLAGLSDALTAGSSSLKEIEKGTRGVHQILLKEREGDLKKTEEEANMLKQTLEAQRIRLEALRSERTRMG
jgi:hypothetical protein